MESVPDVHCAESASRAERRHSMRRTHEDMTQRSNPRHDRDHRRRGLALAACSGGARCETKATRARRARRRRRHRLRHDRRPRTGAPRGVVGGLGRRERHRHPVRGVEGVRGADRGARPGRHAARHRDLPAAGSARRHGDSRARPAGTRGRRGQRRRVLDGGLGRLRHRRRHAVRCAAMASVKGWVWYSPAQFAENGWEIPTTGTAFSS